MLPLLVDRYQALVASGEISSDPAQLEAAHQFDLLNRRLAEGNGTKPTGLGRLFRSRSASRPVKGLYVHGEVGRGKTMLMDEFFAIAVPERKRRTHFHEFMAEVHERVHAERRLTSLNGSAKRDPIPPVAAAIAAETRLLCLDEFAVTDIADAMILSRLFGQLFERGLVLVATSNVPPGELYKDGLNRAHFLPFIDLLRRHAEIVNLVARTDYRLEKLGDVPVYVTPLGADADAALDRIWLKLTGTREGRSTTLPMKGREIFIPQAEGEVARFTFADLCEKPLGPSDYLRIARTYHTVLVDHVPALKDTERNAARRLISLVDTFYDNRVKLVLSAATEPDGIYRAEEGGEAFAIKRTVSRLTEMRSEAWWTLPHGPAAETAGAASPAVPPG